MRQVYLNYMKLNLYIISEVFQLCYFNWVQMQILFPLNHLILAQ